MFNDHYSSLNPLSRPLCSSFSILCRAVASADALGCSCLGNAVYVGGHCFDLGRKGAFLQFLLLQATSQFSSQMQCHPLPDISSRKNIYCIVLISRHLTKLALYQIGNCPRAKPAIKCNAISCSEDIPHG